MNDPLATGGTIILGISGNTVVGTYADASGEHGFVEQNGVYSALNYPASTETAASGISGTSIVGSYGGATGGTQGFVYQNGSYISFNFPSATFVEPGGISGNEIVGFYVNGSKASGFLFNGTTYTTLNDPLGVGGTEIYGIDGNMIVGDYEDSSDVYHGFEANIVAVPEPRSTGLFMLTFGILILVWRISRKRIQGFKKR